MQHNELLCGLLNHFQDILHSEDFLEDFRVPNRFVRKSKLSMGKMVLYLLFNSKSPIDNKLDQLRERFPELDFPAVSKQALSKARYGIRHELFHELFEISSNYCGQ